MMVIRYIVIVCSVSVCACERNNATKPLEDIVVVHSLKEDEENIDLYDDYGDTSSELEKNVTQGTTSVDNTQNVLQIKVNNPRKPSDGDSEIGGSERFVRPVSYSYSSSTQPRVVDGENQHADQHVSTVLQRHPLSSLARNVDVGYHTQRPYQTPVAPYNLVPTVNYARTLPRLNPVNHEVEEKQASNRNLGIKLTHQVAENDKQNGGGEDKKEVDRVDERGVSREKIVQNSQESEEENDYSNSDDYEERSAEISRVDEPLTPKTKTEGHNLSKKARDEQDLEMTKKEYSLAPISRSLNRPEKYTREESGIEKVLHKPLKFAYAEDSKQAASAHNKHHKGSDFEKGGGDEGHSEKYSSHGNKDSKVHKSFHKFDKGNKGHHDKEVDEKEFSDHAGKKSSHKDTGGYFKEHKHGEKGEKGSKFEEKGEHKKGHSTKGEHNIHKKDEYVKKHEFYDEHHEGGEHEKHGGYHEEHGQENGGKFKEGNNKAGYHDDHHGKKGHHKKGGYHDEDKGHKKESGHDEKYEHKEKFGKEHGHKGGKKWRFQEKER